MLSAYVNASDMDGAEMFFKRIKQDGFEPNVITHGTLINGYAKADNLEKMMEKYENMRVDGLKANATIFTTIMGAYGRNKDFGSAVIWFNEMVSSGVSPDQKAKNILLSLAKTEEEQSECKQLIDDLSCNRLVSAVEVDDDDGVDDRDGFEDKPDELVNISRDDQLKHHVVEVEVEVEEAHAL